jgi:membrane fusion protein (multidrug efflux system)
MADSPMMKRPAEPVSFDSEAAGRKPLKIASDAGERTVPSEVAQPIAKDAPEAQPAAKETPAAPGPLKKSSARLGAPNADRPAKKRSLVRPLLFLLLPVALIGGGYMYVTGGQIMSSDNAYIQANDIGVNTDVAGTVIEVDVHENEFVHKGQILYRLKPDTYQIALDGAKAQLGAVHDQILTLIASYKLSEAQIAQAESDLNYYQINFNRQQDLANSHAGTQAALDTARHDLDAIKQKIEVAKVQAQVTLAQLGGNANQPIESNPLYLQAKSGVDNAQSDLNDTIVRAPFDGIVTNVDMIQVGSYLQASQQAFHLVSTTRLWVTASPKETELTYVRPGQPATITVDAYPNDVWHGKVESISPASGASFSLLPAQNTTGNWVKVVQRIPMRVSIDDMAGKPPLRVGMSVTVDVDTGHARGVPTFITDFLANFDGKKAHPNG